MVSEALHANATLNNIDTNGIDVTEFDTVNLDQIKKRKTHCMQFVNTNVPFNCTFICSYTINI